MNAKTIQNKEEQGVTNASLQSTLPRTHFVRAGDSKGADKAGHAHSLRTHCVSTRLSPGELAQLQTDARAAHQRLGSLLRHAYFQSPATHVPAINLTALERLAEALDDLQNLTLLVNAGKLPIQLRPALAATVELINSLCERLVGVEGVES